MEQSVGMEGVTEEAIVNNMQMNEERIDQSALFPAAVGARYIQTLYMHNYLNPQLNDQDILSKVLNSKRGGIIPITVQGLYGLGLSRDRHELIDLGGHRERFDESIYATAIREYTEESEGLLEAPTIQQLQGSKFVYSKSGVIFFWNLTKPINILQLEKQLLLTARTEIETFVWLTKVQLKKLLSRRWAFRDEPYVFYPITKDILKSGTL